MTDTIQLPGSYSLRRVDENTWWLQYLGMDLLRVSASVPCGPGGSIDSDIRKFAEALTGEGERT